MFDKRKIAMLKEKIELIRKEDNSKGKFCLFDTKFALNIINNTSNYDSFNFFYNVLSGWNEISNLPYSFGVTLGKLENENAILIHRTNLGFDRRTEELQSNEILYKIMSEGLKNFGHLSSGGYSTMPSLTQTTSLLDGLEGYINLVSSYKDNDTTIILCLPKDMVDKEGDLKDKNDYNIIYDETSDFPVIKPEYILGAILKKENSLDKFFTKEEIIENYNSKKY